MLSAIVAVDPVAGSAAVRVTRESSASGESIPVVTSDDAILETAIG